MLAAIAMRWSPRLSTAPPVSVCPRERAARRAAQLGEHDPEAVAAQAADLARRDAADAARMVRASDVVEVDTSGRTVASLVDDLAELARRGAAPTNEEHR
jgi:cytidylate kinase